MTQLTINVGSFPDDGLGDPIRTAFQKTNSNFNELYARVQTSPPSTLVGVPGDEPGMYAYTPNYFYYCFAAYDGSTVIWAQLSQIGNLSVTNLVNGTTSISIPLADSNVATSVGGVANVVIVAQNGQYVSGLISATGNVTGGNVKTIGLISAIGNVTGDYFIGNGSQLTGINANYGNSNVASYLPTYTGTVGATDVSATGNVSGQYILGDGSYLTNVSAGNYSNANVAAYLPTYNGNLQGSNVNVTSTLYIGGTAFTRTLTVGTRSSPVTVPMASNNSFNVVGRTGNVVVYTT
jgi:hypothetical protein